MTVPFSVLPASAVELSLIAAQYRSSSLYQFFSELNERLSMLHADVLALLYHFGAHSVGSVLELGPYVGGSTIAIARGLAVSGSGFKVTSVEMGGKYDHPTYATTDIVASLRANLALYAVVDQANVIVGHSRDERVVKEVMSSSEGKPFGCLLIDTDGHVEEDISLYSPLLRPRAYLVVDDYYAPGAPEKEATTRRQIDELEKRGVIESFGVHGWGTWFGRFL